MSNVILIMMSTILFGNIGLVLSQIKKERKGVIGITLFRGMLAGIIGMLFAFSVVHPTEEILKLEVCPENAEDGQIFLTEISVDKKIVKISEPVKGKWLWRGESYGWINTSQTIVKNVTNVVEIRIPVGYQRTLAFETKNIKGDLNVQCSGKTQSIHLEKNKNIKISIPASQKKSIYFYKIMQLVVFVIVSVVMYMFIFNIMKKGKQQIDLLWEKYHYHIIYGCLAVVSLAYMIYNSDRDSLWYDEMHTLGYAMGNMSPNSSYIVFALMKGYLKIIPYGQTYILLLSEVCVAISVYIIGMIGKRLRNGITGVYASAILGFAPYVYHQAAYEYRTYFMLLMSTTIMLYLIVVREKYKNKDTWWFIFIYSFWNMLVMDSHEYGKLVAGMIILIDIGLIIVKKISQKYILSFILPLGYGLYWLLNNEVGGLWNNYSWPPNPTPSIVYGTIYTLIGKNSILLFFFGVGLVFVIKRILEEYKNNKKIWNVEIGYLVSLCMIVAIFAASVIYSNFINPQNSLYVNRYFISVIVFMFILIASGLDLFMEAILKSADKFSNSIIVVSCVGTIICMGWQGYTYSKDEHSQLYRETAQYMNLQEDVYNVDTMVFIPDNGYVVAAWQYYFTEGGKKDSVNIKGKYNIDMEKCEYKKIYVVTPAYQPTEEQQTWLDENYKLEYIAQDYPISVYVRK